MLLLTGICILAVVDYFEGTEEMKRVDWCVSSVEILICPKNDLKSGVVPSRIGLARALMKERGVAVVKKEAGVALKHLPNSLSHRIILGLTGERKQQWYQKL